MLAAALEVEANAYIAELADQRDGTGRRLVVRNGCRRLRKVSTAAGVVEVKAPRVNDKRVDEETGERKRFSSAILPPWCRKSPKISEVLPLLYLHGLSSGDFVPALEQFLGSAAGLSPTTVNRLTQQWQADHAAFMDRDLSHADYVYVWADGIHLNIRLEEAKACVLVLIGVRADGSKELVALTDGYRESAESWADLMRDCARRGMRAPSWRSVTALLASGRPWPRCSPPPASSGAGFIKRPTSSTPCRSPRSPERRRRSRTSTTPRTDHAAAAVKTFEKLLRREVPQGRQEDH